MHVFYVDSEADTIQTRSDSAHCEYVHLRLGFSLCAALFSSHSLV